MIYGVLIAIILILFLLVCEYKNKCKMYREQKEELQTDIYNFKTYVRNRYWTFDEIAAWANKNHKEVAAIKAFCEGATELEVKDGVKLIDTLLDLLQVRPVLLSDIEVLLAIVICQSAKQGIDVYDIMKGD